MDVTYLGILSGALGRFIGIPVLIWIGLLTAVFLIIEVLGGF